MSFCFPILFYSPFSGQFLLQTCPSPDRNHGSGTWEIVSANETNIGESIIDGDKILLINQFYDFRTYLDVYKMSTCDGQYDVQTSISPDRNHGSGIWEIVLKDK